MSSVGQAAGYVVGGIVGSFFGNPIIGAQIGGMLGGYIDPPKGKNVEGPRLTDLSVQTATYGASIPRVYGTTAIFGNVFWLENNRIKESSKTTRAGGKGGAKQKTTTYSYSATFALGLCKGPIKGIKRIWCSGKLIYDGGGTTLSGIIASNKSASAFTVYTGDATQQPDPRMQATLGVANTPAYRGLAYIVFEDFPLEDWGNSMLGVQLKVEVVTTNMTFGWMTETRLDNTLGVVFDRSTGYGVGRPYISRVENGMAYIGVPGIGQSWVISQFTGEVIDVKGDAVYVEAESPLLEYLYFWKQVGRVADGRYLYATYVSPGIIGYGLQQIAGPAFEVTTPIDAAIVAHRIANGHSATYIPQFIGFAKGDTAIFVTVMDTDDWYLLDLDGAIIDQGIWVYTANTQGFGRFGVFSVHLDYAARRLIVASSTNLYVYKIADDKTISQETYISTTVGTNSYPYSAFIDTNHITLVSNDDFQVLKYALSATADLHLADIVQAECLSTGVLAATDVDTSALTSVVKGYAVGKPGTIRSALEPLQAAWPFDAVPDGYKIKFVPRGQASVATITTDELAAVVTGDKPGIRIKQSREMDTQLPRRIELTYLDANREYDVGEQAAERLNTDAINVSRIELAIVMSGDEAAGKAEVLLYLAWLERHDLSFVLPPTYSRLQAADVVTITGNGATYELRLTEVTELPDGRIECQAKFNSSAIYTPTTARGQEGLFTGSALAIPGSCDLLLLDIPCVDSTTMNMPGLLSGLSPMLASWAGGAIFRSDDSGQSWNGVQGIDPPGAISGTVATPIGAGTTHIIDTKNTLNARFHGGFPSSVSDAALFNGANHFAYGAHGRWEIIAAKTVAVESDGSRTLSNLMRGRFGTEWAMTTHAALDMLVLLDASTLRFIALNPSAINATRLWRGVSDGYDLESVADTSLTYQAVNLKPLSPIWLRGSRNPSTLDWTLECTPRSRTPVEPFSGLATPLGEIAASYVFDIFDAGFTTLKRTLDPVSIPSVIYSQTNQIADFGAEPSTVYFKARQVSPLVGNGYAAAGSAYHYLPLDPFGGSVVLAMHMNGVDNSTTFTDLLGNVFTAVGTPKIKTDAAAIGGSAGYFDGSSYLYTPGFSGLDFGSGPGTIEFRFKSTTSTANSVLLCREWVGSPYTGGWTIMLNGLTNAVTIYWADFATGSPFMTASVTGKNDGVDHHFRWAWTGGVHKMFIDGNVVATVSTAATFGAAGSNRLSICEDLTFGPRRPVAYINQLRITRACRSTAAFTPETGPFQDP